MKWRIGVLVVATVLLLTACAKRESVVRTEVFGNRSDEVHEVESDLERAAEMSEMETEMKSEVEAETATVETESEVAVEMESVTEPEPEPRPDPTPAPEPESVPEQGPVADTVTEPVSESVPEVEQAPTPATEMEAEPGTDEVHTHTYVTEYVAATCTESGYEKTCCNLCGEVQSEMVIEAPGHDLYETWFLYPDCVAQGDGHCMRCHNCDYKEMLPVGALGHQTDEGTVYRTGTCTRPAKLKHYCLRCGAALLDSEGSIDANNHDWGIDEETGTIFCTECGVPR